MNRETTYPSPISSEQRDTAKDIMRDNRRKHLYPLLAGAAIVGAAAYGLHAQSSEVRAGNVHEGELNPNISSIQIYDGARVRSDAQILDQEIGSNRLATVDLGDGRYVTLPTPEGVYVEHDENGTWYGIQAEDMSDVVTVDLDDDKDGVVWVNEQRATTNTDSDTE